MKIPSSTSIRIIEEMKEKLCSQKLTRLCGNEAVGFYIYTKYYNCIKEERKHITAMQHMYHQASHQHQLGLSCDKWPVVIATSHIVLSCSCRQR